MSDAAVNAAARSAPRRLPASESGGPFVFDAGAGITVTVAAAEGVPGTRAVKNALERATRIARRALDAGIADAPAFTALLAAIAEAERLAKATKEASDRVKSLVKHRLVPAGTQNGSDVATTPLSSEAQT